MNIFRTNVISSQYINYLIDAEYNGGEIKTLHVRPIVGGVVQASIPLCKFPDLAELVKRIKDAIKDLP